MPFRTLAELFLEAAGHRKSDQLLVKRDGAYRAISSAELVDRVRRLAAALERHGVGHGDRVALMAGNGPHWPAVDFATLASGAVLVPIYPTLLADQAAFIVRDSGARVAFVHHRSQLDGLVAHRAELPELELAVLIEGPAEGEGITGWDAFLGSVDETDGVAFGDRAHAVEPDDLASLVYTSGTTGRPKGVMLTHGNFVSNVETCLELLEFEEGLTALSFLPLSHVFERTVDYCYFAKGISIAYAESVATVGENLGEVRPHLFVSVPRVYEKVLARIHENVEAGSAVKQRIFHWANAVARRALPHRIAEERPPGLLGVQLALADRLVFAKIRDRLGGRFEFAFSGGAPLGREVAEFFWGAGVRIFEGYGLTETSPVISANMPGATRLGTVGRPIPGVEVEIADDGEILVRGPNVMRGYFNMPEETAEVIDEAGWFRTGDIGHLDDGGYLVITDRKKELIVNAYGKNIAPAPIEGKLTSSRYIAQAMVIGDRRKFLSALLVPDPAALETWAAGRGLATGDPEALLATPEVRALLAAEVARVNTELAHHEEVQAWDLLADEWTLEGGELTPTQKIKRRVIRDKYAAVIDGIYRDAEKARARSNKDG